MTLDFYRRPTFVPVFASRKKSKDDFCLKKKRWKAKLAGKHEGPKDPGLLIQPHVSPQVVPSPWHLLLSNVLHLEHPCWHLSVLMMFAMTLETWPQSAQCTCFPWCSPRIIQGPTKTTWSSFPSICKAYYSVNIGVERGVHSNIWEPRVCQLPWNRGFLKPQSVWYSLLCRRNEFENVRLAQCYLAAVSTGGTRISLEDLGLVLFQLLAREIMPTECSSL